MSADDVTVKDFEALCKEAFQAREEIDGLKAQAKQKEAALNEKNKKIQNYLDALDKTSYDSEYGKITVAQYMSVKVPPDPESKQAFFAYLKEKGDFDNLITVNSQTLNSYYKQELANACAAGNPDFSIPGIGSPSYSHRMQYRRKK